MDSNLREQLKDLILTEDEKAKLQETWAWPPDEIIDPPESEDGYSTRYTKPYNAGKFVMPAPEEDFPCHKCEGQYGPWRHRKFFTHDFATMADPGSRSFNIGEVRERYCVECGYKHHNSYSIGQVKLERDTDTGLYSMDGITE